MSAQAYLNLHMPGLGGPARSRFQRDHLRAQCLQAATVIRVLHAAFKEVGPDHGFALDLPRINEKLGRFGLIRVFGPSAQALELLVDMVLARMSEEGVIGQDQRPTIHTVPAQWTGPWVRLERYRIPSRKSFSKSQLQRNCRLERIMRADKDQLPFIDMSSASTKQRFRLYLQRVTAQAPNASDGSTNNYGLSSATVGMSLPDLDRLYKGT